jgi:hypothetical protein
MIDKIKLNLVAPCGMNCSLCLGYQREKNKCPGCRKRDAYQFGCGKKCIIRGCQILKDNKMEFCSDKCEKYPCIRLKNLDKRYKTKYEMSMIENLENIEKQGIEKFLEDQKKRWKCKKCSGVICVHKKKCLNCNSNDL